MGPRGRGDEACGSDLPAPGESGGATTAPSSTDASGQPPASSKQQRRVSFGATTYVPTPFSPGDLAMLWEVDPGASSATTVDPAGGGTTEEDDACGDLTRRLGAAEARKLKRGLTPRSDNATEPPPLHLGTSSLWKRRQPRDGMAAHAPQITGGGPTPQQGVAPRR